MRALGPPDPHAAAEELRPALRARADEIESARRLPADLAATFAEAGFYRMCVPACYGGLELPPAETMHAIETLARGDGSAAWVAFIGATSGAAVAWLPEPAAREVFASPGVRMGGVFAPRGRATVERGGFRVEGRWAWGSGTERADWILAGCQVVRDGEPERLPSGAPRSRMMLVPAAEVEFLDTWHAAGLCGTGSTDFAVHDRFVPAARSVDLTGPPVVERPLYAFPAFGLLAAGIGAVTLGLARAAIDELVALAGGKTPQGSVRPLAARSATQTDVALAESHWRAGRAFLYEALDAAWHAAQEGGALPLALRRDLRLATTFAVRASTRAVDLMYALGGGTSVYRSSPLQRLFRDVHVATQHMMVGPSTLELTGRLLLGIETDTTLL